MTRTGTKTHISDSDPRLMPAYPVALAAGYLHMPPDTLRTWAFGRRYETKGGPKRSEPLFDVPDLDEAALSFINVGEAFVLRAMRISGVQMARVRDALRSVSETLGVDRPLAHALWRTDGARLFVEHNGILRDASKGSVQLALDGVSRVLDRIKWDELQFAAALAPFTREGYAVGEDLPEVVWIDPTLAFGQPVIRGTSVPTEAIADRFAAGDELADLADDYFVSTEDISEAIRWEMHLARLRRAA